MKARSVHKVRGKNRKSSKQHTYRQEGSLKNKGIKPVHKLKHENDTDSQPHKPQGYSAQQRKDYQLPNKRGK